MNETFPPSGANKNEAREASTLELSANQVDQIYKHLGVSPNASANEFMEIYDKADRLVQDANGVGIDDVLGDEYGFNSSKFNAFLAKMKAEAAGEGDLKKAA